MKMTLTVAERFALGGVLPTQGKFQFLRSIRELKRSLALTDQEAKAVNLQQVGERLAWDVNLDAEFEIGEVCQQAIVETLKDLDSKGILKNSQMTLYEKFVDAKHFEAVAPESEGEVAP